MAKILDVSLLSIPEVVIVNDGKNDFSVVVEVEFHDLDIQLNMEYCLHLFVYDIRGNVDAPLVMPNWDESHVLSISLDSKDEYLGSETRKITAKEKRSKLTVPMSLQLGKYTSNYSKKLEVFATIAPAVGRASKWSLPFETRIEH